jgi:imidazolonepropionase-like amidohydrolase/predicted GIY-YIG superfamily endonuclease
MLTNQSMHPFYIGVARSLVRRVWEHKNGIKCDCTSRYKLKGLTRLKKIQLVVSMNPEWKDLTTVGLTTFRGYLIRKTRRSFASLRMTLFEVSMKNLLAVLALTLVAAAQTSPQRTIVIPGRILDVKTGRYLTGQAITIEGDKIVGIAAPGASSGARFINLPTLTVLSGLIDAHTHLTADPYHFGYQELSISTPREALYGAKYAKITLEAGFTTVRNVGANGYSDIALRDAINDGDLAGPRILASGPALGITGGHCDNNLLPAEYHVEAGGVADGIAGVQHKVREVIKYGADVVKICATGGVLSKGDDPRASQYSLEEMKAIVADAHRLGRKVAAHAHGGDGIRLASEAGVDSIEHGTYIDEQGIATLKRNGTYMVPTIYLNQWLMENMDKIGMPEFYRKKEEAVAKVSFDNMAAAIRGGVKIAFGTDAAVYPHGLNARQFAMYVKMGMSPLQAIQSATINAADLLGWADRIGTIEPGKFADLIAVEGDPLQDITTLERVRFVMKGGQVVKSPPTQ